MQKWTATKGREVTRKRNMKVLKPTGNRLEKTTYKNVSVTSRIKTIYIIGERKALHKQVILKSSCLRKETF